MIKLAIYMSQVQKKNHFAEGGFLPRVTHKYLSFFKHGRVALTNLFGIYFSYSTKSNYSHVGSHLPSSDSSSPWFTWLNDMANNKRSNFIPPHIRKRIPSHIGHNIPFVDEMCSSRLGLVLLCVPIFSLKLQNLKVRFKHHSWPHVTISSCWAMLWTLCGWTKGCHKW